MKDPDIDYGAGDAHKELALQSKTKPSDAFDALSSS
jgi:hypothetical protein